MDLFGAAAANAIDEVRKVVAGTFALWPGHGITREPGLVSVISIDAKVSVRSIEEIADGVCLCIFCPQSRFLAFFGCISQSRGRHIRRAISACADLRLVIRDPMADFEFHHPALASLAVE